MSMITVEIPSWIVWFFVGLIIFSTILRIVGLFIKYRTKRVTDKLLIEDIRSDVRWCAEQLAAPITGFNMIDVDNRLQVILKKLKHFK